MKNTAVHEVSNVCVSDTPNESDESIEIKHSEEVGEMPTTDNTPPSPMKEWEKEWGDVDLFNHFPACCVINDSIQESLIPFLDHHQ